MDESHESSTELVVAGGDTSELLELVEEALDMVSLAIEGLGPTEALLATNKTALAMIFKLAEAAKRSWRRLDGDNQLPKLILGVRFADGIEVVRSQAQAAA